MRLLARKATTHRMLSNSYSVLHGSYADFATVRLPSKAQPGSPGQKEFLSLRHRHEYTVDPHGLAGGTVWVLRQVAVSRCTAPSPVWLLRRALPSTREADSGVGLQVGRPEDAGEVKVASGPDSCRSLGRSVSVAAPQRADRSHFGPCS